MNIDDSDFLGVDLSNIKRLLVRPGEMGYDINLHHYYMLSDAEVKVFDKSAAPMAIVRIPANPILSVIAFAPRKRFHEIETLAEPPGDQYEKIILSFYGSDYDDNEDYIQ